MLSGNDEQRDIGTIGLKTVVASVPSSTAQAMVNALTPKLISGIKADTFDINVNSLDVHHLLHLDCVRQSLVEPLRCNTHSALGAC